MGILIAARAACSVTSEKERDSWQSLLSTPLSGNEIILGKVLGSIYAFRHLFGVLFFLWGLAVVISPKYIISVPFTLYTLSVVTVSVASLGVMFSLRMKSSLWAMAATLGVCIFVGGGYFFCCVPFFIVSISGEEALAIVLAPCIPFILAFPGMVSAEDFPSGDEGLTTVAYVLGTIGYTVTAGLLFASACSSFDRFVGRVTDAVSWDGKLTSPFMEKQPDLATELIKAQRRSSENAVEAEILNEGDG